MRFYGGVQNCTKIGRGLDCTSCISCDKNPMLSFQACINQDHKWPTVRTAYQCKLKRNGYLVIGAYHVVSMKIECQNLKRFSRVSQIGERLLNG